MERAIKKTRTPTAAVLIMLFAVFGGSFARTFHKSMIHVLKIGDRIESDLLGGRF